MKREPFCLVRQDGKKIRGMYCIPEDGFLKHPTILISNGLRENYSAYESYADYFDKQGIASILFDFCGAMNSTSEGSADEMTVLTESEDLKTVIGHAKKLAFADEDRIYLMGFSQGGFVSAYTAAECEEIAGLILCYPAFSLQDDTRKRMAEGIHSVFGVNLSEDYDTAATGFDIYEKISGYHGPVLILHGDQDEIVPYSYSEKACLTYNDAVLIDLYGAGHGFRGEDTAAAADYIIEFIENGPEEMCPMHSVLLTNEVGRFYYVPPFSYRKEDIDRIDGAMLCEASKLEGKKREINKAPLVMRNLEACGIAMSMDVDADTAVNVLTGKRDTEEMIHDPVKPLLSLCYSISDLRTFAEIFRKKGDNAFSFLKNTSAAKESEKYHNILRETLPLAGTEGYEELSSLVNEIFCTEPAPLSMEDIDIEDQDLDHLRG